MGEWSGNPAERPGAIVIRPERDSEMVFDPEHRSVVDLRNGDSFKLAGARAESRGRRHFLILNSGGDFVLRGLVTSSSWSGQSVYELHWIAEDLVEAPDIPLERAKAQVERLSRFLRRHDEGVAPATERTVVVVDSRANVRKGTGQ